MPSAGSSARSGSAARMPSSRNVGGSRTSRIATSASRSRTRCDDVVGVAQRAGGDVAGLVEQAHEPLAQQHGVLDEHDAQRVAEHVPQDRRVMRSG